MTRRVSPTEARFIHAKLGVGMYESWYVRLVAPDRPLAAWIRFTIDKAPGRQATGTTWFTLFDGDAEGPVARRQADQETDSPEASWVRIGVSEIGPGHLEGECFDAGWKLDFKSRSEPLFHLPRPRLYTLPLPKTKPISPVPFGEFEGSLSLGERTIEVDVWQGMVGHNWGSEHAERWIWLHGSGFTEDPDAWIDIAMGRLRVAGRLLPWVANGAIHHRDTTRRVGGLFAPGVEVHESATRLDADLPVAGKGTLKLEIDSPENLTVGWRYGDPADPNGEAHEVANCSAARMTAQLAMPNGGEVPLNTPDGAVYELGMTESDHGIPIESGLPPDHPGRSSG